MTGDLSAYTKAELLAELAKRNGEKKVPPRHKQEKGWYYDVVEINDLSDAPIKVFEFVEKDYWERTHEIPQVSKARDTKRYLAALPPGFALCTEWDWEFNGTPEKAEELLREYGFTRLELSRR